MKISHLALGIALAATAATAARFTSGSAVAADQSSPESFMQGSFPDPTGHTLVEADGHVTVDRTLAGAPAGAGLASCTADIKLQCPGQAGFGSLACLAEHKAALSTQCKGAVTQMIAANGGAPPCSHSPVCGNRMGGVGPRSRAELQRVEWKPTLAYTYDYGYTLPKGFGGVPAVGLDSKGDLWAYKRSPAGTPQLYELGPDRRLIRTVGDDVIGHSIKAHGMAIDAHDNVWITDASTAVVEEVSPEGKLLRTIGVRGHRGDWVEETGQRLLWEPLMVAFAPGGDIYIAEGHGNESPNDTDSADPMNRSGASRIIHLDKNGAFVNQWYGNNVGQGQFSMAHAIAVDPTNGDVWIGDREQYRIVVYDANGHFIKTLQMRNLVCALYFDPHGQLWMGSGQDGQFLKIDRNGRVLGAIGNGMGIGPGQFIEASYFVVDAHDNVYAGDTSVGRITKMAAPR